MLSNKSKYALKALIALARAQNSGPQMISIIAAQESLPQKFLELILLELKQSGLVESRRGKTGGYLLAKDPRHITVGEIIRFFEGPLALLPCASVSRYKPCEECIESLCSLRKLMREVRDRMAELLDHTTLADMLEREKEGIQYHYDI